MKCKKCGTEIADKALICYRCGTSTFEPPPPAAGQRRRTRLLPTLIAVVILVVVGLFLALATASQAFREFGWVLLVSAAVLIVWRLLRRR
jgi:hypothetical protein